MAWREVDAALAGLGITLLPEDEVMAHIEACRLVRGAGGPVFAIRRLSSLLPEPAAAHSVSP